MVTAPLDPCWLSGCSVRDTPEAEPEAFVYVQCTATTSNDEIILYLAPLSTQILSTASIYQCSAPAKVWENILVVIIFQTKNVCSFDISWKH